METFIILLVIVFVPFIWFIYKMIRYTDDTIGENSPLYRERTYEILTEDYFVTFYKGMLAVIFIQFLIIVKILVGEAIRQADPRVFIPALFFFFMAVYLTFIFYVDWQYWTITRDVQLTLNPFDSSIHIDSPTQLATLTPENVDYIESHLRKSDNPKEPLYGYGYLLFYLTDGTIVWVNNLFFADHAEFLERHFKGKPLTTVYHRIPWVRELLQSEK
ncbi:hypothetical protein M0L20_09515 [Spirosoma sp. RP8]|uniref:PH domain-containing protein n=1 Tax=Spirosoma liriopis TaxID=2937440 RepID=A0ABT0HIV1_9BACT|nr:hypothetical protein [Spirosoma liriopis]MCK8492084.1 hypothetical protein [Spirosoma liriopis]